MDSAVSTINQPDTVAILAQIGRFDLVSLLLAAIGLILLLGGVFSFLNLRSLARAEAIREAKAVAEVVSERATNEYLQREWPELIREYREFSGINGTTDQEADRLAAAQENGKSS